jgi:hypothetical protein
VIDLLLRAVLALEHGMDEVEEQGHQTLSRDPEVLEALIQVDIVL